MASTIIIKNQVKPITVGMKTLPITNGIMTAASISSISFSMKPNHNLYSSNLSMPTQPLLRIYVYNFIIEKSTVLLCYVFWIAKMPFFSGEFSRSAVAANALAKSAPRYIRSQSDFIILTIL